MRNYQRQKNNPYKLPDSLYRRMIDMVRDYERMKAERDDIINGTPNHDGTGSGGLGNPTEAKALKLIMISRDCDAVEKAFGKIPTEYHEGLKNNILYGMAYPYTAHRNTYGYQRSRLAYFIAKYSNLI